MANIAATIGTSLLSTAVSAEAKKVFENTKEEAAAQPKTAPSTSNAFLAGIENGFKSFENLATTAATTFGNQVQSVFTAGTPTGTAGTPAAAPTPAPASTPASTPAPVAPPPAPAEPTEGYIPQVMTIEHPITKEPIRVST